MDVLDRIAQKFEIDDENGCWVWTAAKFQTGYGMIVVDRKLSTAHRVMWERTVGPIPEGLEIDHLCRNRSCCNPDHLEPVTHAENMRRSPIGAANFQRAKTHCPRGHPYDETNTQSNSGYRRCRTCHNDRERKRRNGER